jgi:hypothetical protein
MEILETIPFQTFIYAAANVANVPIPLAQKRDQVRPHTLLPAPRPGARGLAVLLPPQKSAARLIRYCRGRVKVNPPLLLTRQP